MDIGKGSLRAVALTAAAGVLATMMNVASATPIRPNGGAGLVVNAGMEACNLFGNSGQGYGNACDPDLNADGGVNALDIGRIRNGLLGGGNIDSGVNPNGRAFHFSMRFGRPGQGYMTPGAPGGIRVTEPATLLLLLAGSFAWRSVRRRRG